MGGLLFTAITVRQSTKSRKESNLLALTEAHRDLWSAIYSRPDLSRIFDPAVDLIVRPINLVEERFLNEVIIHFQMGWHLAKKDSFLTMEALESDIRQFFKLPIPHSVWTESKHTRDPHFVAFVENCLSR